MNLLSKLASLTIATAAVLTFYTALLHLTRRKIHRSHVFRIVRDLIVGTQTLQLYFLSKDMQLEHPFLLYPFITLLFITGPLNYIRYFMFLYPGKKIPLRIQVQLIPAAIILAWETWFYFFNPQENLSALRSVFSDPAHSLVTYLIAAGVIVSLVQYGMLLRLEIGFTGGKETRAPVLLSSAIMLFYMLDILMIASGFFFANRALMLVGVLFMGVTGITYLLFENRFPDFYQLMAREERENKYKKSLIQGLSKEKIIERLKELMEVEQIYRQLELKLDDVAVMLLITPHQLSEFINDCMRMNFTSYINQYRVSEAKELLADDPEMNILSIAYEVGFGSKQSFNTIFKQQTGMTPSGYRQAIKNQ
jgi:AraC-like DNA-binding protein